IEASAGTGKTTRLVKVLLEALWVREIPMDKLLALTFTKKAAGEMRERVGKALSAAAGSLQQFEELRQKPWCPSLASGASRDHIRRLSEAALEVMDRAEISTLHSFAFALLKRFPAAAGVDPEASIDDKGIRFDRVFDEEWSRWIAVELAADSPRKAEWLELLSLEELPALAEVAKGLCDFHI